jgi:hypothetical protein
MIVPGSTADWIQAIVFAGVLVAGALFLSRSLVDDETEIEPVLDGQIEERTLVGVGAA